MNDLNARILAAHAAGDHAAFVGLYTKAADQAADRADDHDTACFFLTHAYVFALELADPRAPALHARLVAAGREE